MSVHTNLSDTVLLAVGTATGIAGLTYDEIDVILGIILKLVSIVSFIIVAIVNVNKLFSKEKTLKKRLEELKNERDN